jgi:uncharacterized repeat protein (TIGR03803 family)
MKTRSPHGFWTIILMLASPFLATVSFPLTAQAEKFKVLYKFTNGADGGNPSAGLVFDTTGNLYGTTSGGGDSGCFDGCGTVFELSPGLGGWSESTLHTFTGGSDGGDPFDKLIIDATGNLYGTANVGGISCGENHGCGVAFELTPGSGSWKETALYSFQGGTNGYYPIASLTLDKHGNLYSTLSNGGNYEGGSVYELTDGTSGWKEETLYNSNGGEPAAAPILDSAGNLYGTTSCCGGGGTVFELLHGNWKERTLFTFNGSGGGKPEAQLVFDKAGNLYGTTEIGGKYDMGTVFKLARGAKGKWKESVLYSLKGGTDGAAPFSTPIFDSAGNLYATTMHGGSTSCGNGHGCGTVFKLTPGKNGRWKETVLHRFTGGSDGAYPYFVTLAMDAAGNLYGTTVGGGNAGCGSIGCGLVFEITP